MKFSTFAVAICVGFVAPAAALNGGYMNSISGGSAAKPPANAAFMPKKAAAVAPAAPAASTGPAAPAANSAPTSASYLQQMGGGGGSMGASSGPKTSYAPTKSNVGQKAGGSGFGSYLDNVASGASVDSSYSAPPAASTAPAAPAANSAPTSASYLQQMGGGSPMGSSSGPKTSYAPTKSNVGQKAGGSGFGSYLDNVASGTPVEPSYSAPAPVASSGPAAPTAASYLGQMGGGSSAGSGPKTSYAPTKSNVAQKSSAPGFGSYLSDL